MSRTCPLCQTLLTPRTSRGITVDVCPDCTGIWLDAGEYDVIIAKRVGGIAEADFGEARAPTRCRKCGRTQTGFACDECKARLAVPCPVDQTPMLIVTRDSMEFDRCPACKGIWIDGDERLALGKKSEPAPSMPDGKLELARKPSQRQPHSTSAVFEKRGCTVCGALAPAARGVQRADQWVCEACVVDGALATLDDRWRRATPPVEPVHSGLAGPIAMVVFGGLLGVAGVKLILDSASIAGLGIAASNALPIGLVLAVAGLATVLTGARRFARPSGARRQPERRPPAR